MNEGELGGGSNDGVGDHGKVKVTGGKEDLGVVFMFGITFFFFKPKLQSPTKA